MVARLTALNLRTNSKYRYMKTYTESKCPLGGIFKKYQSLCGMETFSSDTVKCFTPFGALCSNVSCPINDLICTYAKVGNKF